MTDVLFWIWIQKKLGYASRYALDVLRHPGGARFFYESSEAELMSLGIWPEKIIHRLHDHSLDEAEMVYMKCLALGYNIVTPESNCYPVGLRRIADPPMVLYVDGDLTAINKDVMIAVVGTRRASDKNISIAQELGYRLSQAGAVVVSGCAVGIDTAAHSGSVAAGGMTVGVLGCGIDNPYNKKGAELRNAITACGALISEYPPGTEAWPMNFPQRNRIISGLSLGVTVIQAGRKSGSLITAKLALEQGRDLFAYYNEDNLETLAGIHSLGESNVTLFESPDEILRPFEARFGKYINFDGMGELLGSRPEILPDNIPGIISGISAQVVEQRRIEAIRPTAYQNGMKPVADVSLETARQMKHDYIVTDASSERARRIAMPADASVVVNYGFMDDASADKDAGNNARYPDDPPAEEHDPAKESTLPEKPEESENKAKKPEKADIYDTDSIIGLKYNKRSDDSEGQKTRRRSLADQIIISAEQIGLSPEQIDALLVQLGKNGENAAEPQAAEEPEESSYAHSESKSSKSDPLPDDISDEARKLYGILSSHSDTIDNISILAGFTVSMTAEFMLELELYGLVHSLPGGIYAVSEYYYQ